MVTRKRSSNMQLEQRDKNPLENQTIVRQHRIMSPQARPNHFLIGKEDNDNDSGD